MINEVIKQKDLEDIAEKVFNNVEKGLKLIRYETSFGTLTIAVPKNVK